MDRLEIYYLSGDYAEMRRALNAATAVYCETAWGPLTVSKSEMLRATKCPRGSAKGRVYRWRLSSSGAIWCDDWTQNGLCWSLRMLPEREPIEAGGVHPTTREGVST